MTLATFGSEVTGGSSRPPMLIDERIGLNSNPFAEHDSYHARVMRGRVAVAGAEGTTTPPPLDVTKYLGEMSAADPEE